MDKKFNELNGYEGSITDLSNKLQTLGCEDICWFGNWDEILEQKNVIVATDEQGNNHIKLDFEITILNGEDEKPEASIIKITNVEEF